MRTMQIVVALVVALGFHGIGQASAPYQDMELARGGAEQTRHEEQAILRAVQGFAESSIRSDPNMMAALWDDRLADEASFIHSEGEEVITGLENILAYHENWMQYLDVYDAEVTNVHIQRMGNIATVSCVYHWVFKSLQGGPMMSQPTRATIVLRKQGQRWLYVHMHESISFHP